MWVCPRVVRRNVFPRCGSGLPGLVVSLSEDGEVRVSYMGTDPPTSVVHATDSKELNYDEMDEEHRRLLVTIRENQSGG